MGKVIFMNVVFVLSLVVCAVNTKEAVLKVSHRLLINLPPTIHTLHPGADVTVRVGSKVGTLRSGFKRLDSSLWRVGTKDYRLKFKSQYNSNLIILTHEL